MRKGYRRALIVVAVLGVASFLVVAVHPAAHAAIGVWIPPSPGLNGVQPRDVQLGTTPSQYPDRDGVARKVYAWGGGCMDADSDTVRQDGGKVQLFECNTSVFQQWFLDRTGIEGLYRIRTVYRFDGCLDADNSVPAGGRIQVWHCLDMNQHNQLWWLVTKGNSATLLRSDWNGQCIQVGGNGRYGSTLVLANCAEVFPQTWWPINATMEPNWPTSPWP
ncbi:MAG: hypothetical protein AUG49_04380 [Catenulispora sp. 13_1_20CM_3_70_7]|nr:MAG: hypothetical protein AUG49_04380 [Catenulispora sp. 13_1_20CM_3_70_7]